MRLIGIILLCVTVILSGMNVISRQKKQKSALENLSAFFQTLSVRLENGKSDLPSCIAQAGKTGSFPTFVFPAKIKEKEYGQNGIADSWCLAMEEEFCFLGSDILNRLCELSVHFRDEHTETLTEACLGLSAFLKEEEERFAERSRVSQKLILAGSFLGALAVFIIFI